MRALLAVLLLWPALAWAQTGDAACTPGSRFAAPVTAPYVSLRIYLTDDSFGLEGGAVIWHCWTGTEWRSRSRLMHAQDVGGQLRAVFDARIAAWAQTTTQAEREALVKQWDTSADVGFCDRMIGNAGYAARLCGLVHADMDALRPTAPWQGTIEPPPPPPPPVEVWTVAPSGIATTRPTRIWPYQYTAGGSIRAAAERAPVGSPCDPAVGAGDWRGVLGRTDRVAVCVHKQPQK
ncbi:hypothetical protein [Arenimonas sp.]|uniref:hypothetical protein n=1 Tax=Arenimonas sp. TaxID=1872635 RepID=UPI0025C00041|nr:hypothetical protein [Arenimonas sp.]